jgi:Flp pilus assembly pilin Flp
VLLNLTVRGQTALALVGVRIRRRLAGDGGGSAAEYALLIGLIALVLLAGATILGNAVNDKLSDAAAGFE